MSSVGLSAIAIVSFYVCANALIVAAAALLAGIRTLNGALPRPLSFRQLLAIGRTLTATGLVLPGLALWHGGSELSPLQAQVWAAPSIQAGAVAIANDPRIDFAVDSENANVSANTAAGVALLILALGLAVTLVPLSSEARATFRAIRGAHAVRGIGSLRILVSDTEQVPFAAWIPGRSFIVLPA